MAGRYPPKGRLYEANMHMVRRELLFNVSYTPQQDELWGSSQHTKTIRSATPRGFSRALFQHYKDPA